MWLTLYSIRIELATSPKPSAFLPALAMSGISSAYFNAVLPSLKYDELTTERYYCRARADLAFARVNDAFNSVFAHEPAIAEKND